MLQHRYEFNTQLEYWDTEDYFRLLTEHAIRGLMLLGAPHPKELLSEAGSRNTALLSRVFCCCRPGGSGRDSPERGGGSQGGGWATGLVLADSEVQEIRDILLVLIIAAEHYSLQHDGGEYTRLLTFCKRVCKFFNKCSDSGACVAHLRGGSSCRSSNASRLAHAATHSMLCCHPLSKPAFLPTLHLPISPHAPASRHGPVPRHPRRLLQPHQELQGQPRHAEHAGLRHQPGAGAGGGGGAQRRRRPHGGSRAQPRGAGAAAPRHAGPLVRLKACAGGHLGWLAPRRSCDGTWGRKRGER